MKPQLTLLALFSLIFTLPIQAQEKTVTLCGLDWPPHSSVQLKNNGYAMQIITEAFANTGYKVIKKWSPWARAFQDSQHGECILQDANFNQERLQWFWFSMPYASNRIVIVSRAQENIDLSDPSARYIAGQLRGSTASNLSANAAIERTQVGSYAQAIKMIAMGRIDLFVGSKLALLYEARQINRLDDIALVGEPLSEDFIHLAFSNKDQKNLIILADFNQGLFQLLKSGRYQKIMEEHGF